MPLFNHVGYQPYCQQDSYFVVEDMGVTFGVRLGGVDSVALYGSTLSVSDFSRVHSVCHCCMSKEWQMAMESAGSCALLSYAWTLLGSG